MNTVFYFEDMLLPHMGNFISLPKNLENYDKNQYPHWEVFKIIHLFNEIDTFDLKHNAQVIAQFSEEDIKKKTIKDLIQAGLLVHTPTNQIV